MDLPENELRGYIEDNGKPMWTAHNNHNIRYFKEEEIRIITNNYDTLLGKGGFGEVYKGVLDDNSSVAVKRYIHNVKENFAKEVIVHSEINHRNVVRLIGRCIGEDALMIVTEYVSRGNLSDILHCSEISISLETRLDIAIGCAEALSYMHSQMYGQVIHGDIKPANILLDDNLNAKISDFGISKLLSTDNTLYASHVIGSIGYMDPLFARNGRLASKSDVYSFGVVLLELITRRKAVDDGKINLIENFTQAQAKRKKIREFYDVKVADENNLRILDGIGKLAAKCLAMDLEKRPEMKDVAESLRMFRKAQYQSQEKILLFGWVRRSKRPPQNMVPTDKHLHGNQVLKAEVQAQKASEVDRDVHNVTVVREGSPRLYSFGSSQGIELQKLLEASAEVLGRGKYASTYKVVLDDGFTLTVKRLKNTIDVPEAVFKERIAAIGTIEHELVVPLRQYYYMKDEKILVYDYFPNISLASILHGKDMVPVGWETRSAIALSVARAVTFIHSTNAAAASHGDLNSSIILLTGSYEARVSEHGLKTLVSDPTLLIDNNITQKDDVYSFGVILLELLTGPELKPDLKGYEEFRKLAIHCCNKNPTLRPTMSEVAQQIEALREYNVSTAGNRQLTGSNAGREEQTFSLGT
ncbi:wall-associated receptor kinase 3-like isoform X2 [Miscanthus floridulus]